MVIYADWQFGLLVKMHGLQLSGHWFESEDSPLNEIFDFS